MNLLDLFRRKPLIRDIDALTAFIDQNAAFLVQKGLYEYSRARAGHYSKVLFDEAEFRDAMESSRWRAYPLGLAMVAEAADAVLNASGGADNRKTVLDAVTAATLTAFDGYPVPAKLGPETWRDLRRELVNRLQHIGLHPPKRAMDIPLQYAQGYFDLIPIHEKLRQTEFATITSYLRVTLCNIYDELSKRIDRRAFMPLLQAGASET